MTQVLANFVQVLRAANVPVSTAESVDAALAVQHLGFDARDLLRLSLSQVLAKTPEDKETFFRCFDEFFRFETPSQPSAGASAEADAPDPTPGGASPPGSGSDSAGNGGLFELLADGDATALQQALAQAARNVQLQNIRLFTQRGIYVRRILEALGIEAMEARLRAMAKANGNDPAVLEMRQRSAQLAEDVGALVERQMQLYTANAGTALREEFLQQTPLTRVEMRDFKQMQALVKKLAHRLVSLYSRRRRVANRGQLDLRGTLRRNLRHDGLLFDTVWKRTRIDRPKVVAVCDVSGSVAQVARFLLLFLYSVSEVLPKVRSFAFSNQLGEVTQLFEQKPVEDAITATLATWGMGSTDYGGALAELERLAGEDIDHRTTVLILGDARSNYGDPGDRVLRRLHARARRVIWLNPEPKSFWDLGDSAMQKLAAGCDRVASCRTIVHLERIVSEIARTAV